MSNDNIPQIALDEFVQLEYHHMVDNKSRLEANILYLYNTRNITRAHNTVYYYLYGDNSDKLGFRLNYDKNLWKVTIEQNKQQLPYFVKIIIHNGTNDNIGKYKIIICLVPTGKDENNHIQYRVVSNSEYQIECNKYLAFHDKTNDLKLAEYVKALDICTKFVEINYNSIIDALKSKSWSKYSTTIESIINAFNSVSVITSDSINRLIKNHKMSVKGFISKNFEPDIDQFINVDQCSETHIMNFKIYYIRVLRNLYLKEALLFVRKSLLSKLDKNGIESIVKDVQIDNTLNLGDFNYVTSLLEIGVKNYSTVIKESFIEEQSPRILEARIIQLLKLYYEFQHPTEKNEQYLVQFLKDHNITKSKFIYKIADIPGGSGVEHVFGMMSTSDKDKYRDKLPNNSIYRFKKIVNIRKAVYNEQDINGKWIKKESTVTYGDDLLSNMKAIIPMFNDSFKHTKIFNIEPYKEKKNSFIFDFITYRIDDEKIDGRRLSEFTAMYNRAFDDVLYLSYDNSN